VPAPADAAQERSAGRVSQSQGRPLRLSHADIGGAGRAVGPRPGEGQCPRQGRGVPGDPGCVTGRDGPLPYRARGGGGSGDQRGDPLRDLHPLFDLPVHPAGTSVSGVAAFPGAGAPGAVLVRAGRRGSVESFPLFGG